MIGYRTYWSRGLRADQSEPLDPTGSDPSNDNLQAPPARTKSAEGGHRSNLVQDSRGALGLGTKARVLHVFASFSFGGVPIRMSRVISHLGDKYRHIVIALDGRFDCKTRLRPDLQVRYLEVELSKSSPIWAVLQARVALKQHRPDLLMTYNWGAIEWAMAHRLSGQGRHIHCESGFGVEEARGQIARRSLFRRMALARADHLIVPSETLVQIATKVWKIDARKIVQIANGVDVGLFQSPPNAETCRRIGLVENEPCLIIGTVAPLRPEKNLDCLLRAFARLVRQRPVRLVILGDGSERARLTKLSLDLGVQDQVVFAGHIEAVEEVLGAFDLFVLSSDTEQMPNSLIQAMAAGLPVAATDVGDVRAMLPVENHRFLVPAGNDSALATALEGLLSDHHLRAELGNQNRSRASLCFNEQRMLSHYTEILNACLADSH